MATANPMKTPMVSTETLTTADPVDAENPSLYRTIVGGLQYVTVTRSDIAYAVNKVCQFTHAPKESHWQVVKRILWYLRGTGHYGLTLSRSSNLKLTAFCDVDWGSDVDDRRSTASYCVCLGSNLVLWSSKKQVVVSKSSTEVEYCSLATVTAKLIWLKTLLIELHLSPTCASVVYCDNLSAVMLASNPILLYRTKHFELDLYFIWEKIQNKELCVHHISSTDQTADVLTKPISFSMSQQCRFKLRVQDTSPLNLQGGVKGSVS